MLNNELVALAKARSGKSQLQMAQDMGHNGHTRLSKIAKGQLEPDASEIIYLANAAKMEPIEVLADIESARHPELATVWKETLERLRKRDHKSLVMYSYSRPSTTILSPMNCVTKARQRHAKHLSKKPLIVATSAPHRGNSQRVST